MQAVHLDQKGRGRALRAAWSASPAPVVAYMDVDLSTDLDALLPLVAPLVSGHSDVAIGTRLAAGSRVVRGPKREAISRTLQPHPARPPCAAASPTPSAGSRRCAPTWPAPCCPLVEDKGWFFDTELLVLAEHNGLRIHEVPVDWVDDPSSTVDVVRTARTDLLGVARMLRAAPGAAGRALLPLLGILGAVAVTPGLSFGARVLVVVLAGAAWALVRLGRMRGGGPR